MRLDGFYGENKLENYYQLIDQIPDNEIIKQGITMAIEVLEAGLSITHLGTTRRVMLQLNIDIDNENFECVELSIWINDTYNNISATAVECWNSKRKHNDTYYEEDYDRKKIFEIFRDLSSGIKVVKKSINKT